MNPGENLGMMEIKIRMALEPPQKFGFSLNAVGSRWRNVVRTVFSDFFGGWGCNSEVECLPSLSRVLGLIPSTKEQKRTNKNFGGGLSVLPVFLA
jgi:hypothetical protein